MNDIVIGRDEKDRQKYGEKGVVLLGKHYVKMGRISSLSNKVFLDVTKSHVVFVCGKRGGGKSYSLGVIAEGISDLPPDIRQNISIILLDTMGVYWTMKYPNKQDKDLLEEWGLEPKGLDVKIFTPDVEVPFAGHPTLGTAFIIKKIIENNISDVINLNLSVGQIPVTFEQNKDIWMKADIYSFHAIFNHKYLVKQFLN